MTSDEITRRDGVLIGPIRRPINASANAAGSIHDDSTAQKLGFRGGTIAGSIHMEQFPPILLRAFGPRWFETGSLSLYFRNATTHEEPVRCLVQQPPADATDVQVEVSMEREDGLLVCDGTASVGTPDRETALRERVARVRAPGDIRILARLEPGMKMEPTPARISGDAVRERLKVTTEPLGWYEGTSPWDEPIATPTLTVQALRGAEAGLAGLRDARAVGLFGAIEIKHLAGPVFPEHDYVASGEVLAVGDSPKSEFFWYESQLAEAEGAAPIASMIMMLRFMKGSSPLWQS